jgi:hypothetical protein
MRQLALLHRRGRALASLQDYDHYDNNSLPKPFPDILRKASQEHLPSGGLRQVLCVDTVCPPLEFVNMPSLKL